MELFNKIYSLYQKFNNKKIHQYTSEISTKTEILQLREKIYKTIRTNADTKINEIDEFAHGKKSIYVITKINNNDLINLFFSYVIFYIFDSFHSTKKLIIGLDFEFHENQIQLTQIAFYPLRKYKPIFILDHHLMSDKQFEIFVDLVFYSDLYRICHGSDSLDIPALFKSFFKEIPNNLFLFMKTQADTRYLCEYYKKATKFEDHKCSIYDALLFFGTITQKKYDELVKNSEVMGPSQDVNWNIKLMSSYHLKYTSRDVIFLRKLIKDIFEKAQTINEFLPKQLDYIQSINRMITYEKYGISDITLSSKQILDPVNNYLVFNKKYHSTLLKTYNLVIDKIEIPDIKCKATMFLEINYFKKLLSILFKRAIYSILTSKYNVFMRKGNRYTTKITFFDIFPKYKKLELHKLVNLLEKFYVNAEIVISSVINP